jgi:hypothetical protein
MQDRRIASFWNCSNCVLFMRKDHESIHPVSLYLHVHTKAGQGQGLGWADRPNVPMTRPANPSSSPRCRQDWRSRFVPYSISFCFQKLRTSNVQSSNPGISYDDENPSANKIRNTVRNSQKLRHQSARRLFMEISKRGWVVRIIQTQCRK